MKNTMLEVKRSAAAGKPKWITLSSTSKKKIIIFQHVGKIWTLGIKDAEAQKLIQLHMHTIREWKASSGNIIKNN